MRRSVLCATLFLVAATSLIRAQTPAPKRNLLDRVLHPFGSSEKIPNYDNPKLNGLQLSIDLPDEPIKLAEVRQLPVTVRLTNVGKRAVELSFPTEQRIEILLHDSSGRIVTRWSENRAFSSTPGMVLINPDEHLEYAETIATRELSPGRVFTVEVTMPAYPELDVKRKAIAAP
jgi:hypothetical protein